MTQTHDILTTWTQFSQMAGRLLEPIQNEQHHQEVEAFLDDLTDQMNTPDDPRFVGLFRLLAHNLHVWEEQHVVIEDTSPHLHLKALMEERGLKQVDLGHIIPQSNLSKILKGEREISKEVAKELARFFKVDVALFI
ncbi:helix-turn-helix domain-containing protein [Deinococcus cellulosilyticus]|uniref:HTH cro/C1-type domain-containing protein n=1 Tax=Deinococcus cellulosilyticus (strain DSM 18568 / NBRC 106333 / KACC 11606 / 5516J-15) TaxID=1223518 RepID=A0A511NC20_DEIC1|nr:helix-turn-helix domain-containing protein [Deinococcus cellulosilyticus]GEM50116.1 hypothetical protein DC3_57510 [Deinococcus cellulosilyticus NBRC 106333 = KACC 11606]